MYVVDKLLKFMKFLQGVYGTIIKFQTVWWPFQAAVICISPALIMPHELS